MEKITARRAALAVIAIFLIVSFANITHYGEAYDEDLARDRGKFSTQLALNTLGMAPELGPREYAYLKALKHPPFFSILNYNMARLGSALGLGPTESRHYFIILWSAMGLIFLFLLTARLFDEKTGFYAVFLLTLFPSFLAHAHFNPKDIPLMVNATISIYFFVRFIDKPNLKRAILSGAVYGLTIATHLNALFLMAVLLVAATRRQPPALMRVAWLGAVIFFLYAGWPLLWREPLYIFTSIKGFTGRFMEVRVLYMGNSYTASNLPWHYTLVQLLMSTPVALIVLFLIGAFNCNSRRHLLVWVWALLPILSQSLPGVSRYDGMRHAFIAVAPMAIIAGVGLDKIITFARTKVPQWRGMATSGIIGFIVLLVAPQIAKVHPYEMCYRNEVVRLLIPENFESFFSPTDWGSSVYYGMKWLNENAPFGATVCTDNPHQAREIKREDIKLDCKGAYQYRMLRVNNKEHDSLSTLTPVFTKGPYNSKLIYVYKVE